jgi:hypothetical protein
LRTVRSADRSASQGHITATLLHAPPPGKSLPSLRQVVKSGHAQATGTANPSPFRDQTPAPEQIGRDLEAVEAAHVPSGVDVMQKDRVHERESESSWDAGQETAPWRRCAL